MANETSNRKIVAAVLPGDAFYEDVLRVAHRLANGSAFAVLNVHSRPLEWVKDPLRTPESKTADARSEMARRIELDIARMGLRGGRVVVPLAQRADVGDDIIDQARSLDATLVMVGTHGRRGLDAWVMGSVAEAVVRRAHCHVYVVRNRSTSDA